MNANIEMLNYIYKNAQMGQDSINRLLNIIKEESNFRQLLDSQFKEYKNISDKAKQALNKFGHEGEDNNTLQKLETYIMINIKTINNKTPDHIAEMLIQGSTMGIVQITRRIKQYEGTLDNNIENLAKKLLATEQHNIDDCKKFLGESRQIVHA